MFSLMTYLPLCSGKAIDGSDGSVISLSPFFANVCRIELIPSSPSSFSGSAGVSFRSLPVLTTRGGLGGSCGASVACSGI